MSRELKKLRDFHKSDYTDEEVSNSLMDNKRVLNQKKSVDKALLYVAITLVSFTMYGFIPGISSYSALPYGRNIMHLCSTLCKDFCIFFKSN